MHTHPHVFLRNQKAKEWLDHKTLYATNRLYVSSNRFSYVKWDLMSFTCALFSWRPVGGRSTVYCCRVGIGEQIGSQGCMQNDSFQTSEYTVKILRVLDKDLVFFVEGSP